MKNNHHWVKVSMVSGILMAGLLSRQTFAIESRAAHNRPSAMSDYDTAKVFKGPVLQYSIDRRQWVDIGLWMCQLRPDDGSVSNELFYPAGERTLCLDARHMNVFWQGDKELFAEECEIWIRESLCSKGLTCRFLQAGSDGAPAVPPEEKAAVDMAFDRWCRELLGEELRSCGNP